MAKDSTGSDKARTRLLAASLALLSALALGASPAHGAAGTPLNFSRTTYAYSSQWSPQQEAGTYNVMLMQSTDSSMVRTLKAANPNLKIFVYQALLASQNVTNSYVTCTNGPSVLASHPSWILKDQAGNPILTQGHYLMDVANPAYQQACVAHAIAVAKQGGFDGVYWDMVNAQLVWTLPSGTTVPEYPTIPSWQAAMYSMLQYAAPQLHANGLMDVANIGGAFLTPGLWQQWNGQLDGAEEEGWTDDKQGTAALAWAWPKQLAEAAWSEANGKLLIVHSWNTTHAGDTYGLASMLLIAGGESSYSTSNGCYTSCEVWWPEYSTAQQLGPPAGPYQLLSNGVYERWFQNGVVLVNPTTNAVSSFPLGGTFTGSGLTSVSSLSMGPTSGYILLNDSPTTASAPVATQPPSISAAPALGQTVTASPGAWSGSPAPNLTYQWSRCSTTTAASCSPIAGASATSYTVGTADLGQYLMVSVAATNSAGTASASSPLSAQVPTPSFGLTESPGSATITRGSTIFLVATVHAQNGWTGKVSFSATGLPTGARTSWVPASSATAGTLVVTSSSSSVGTWHITITGTAGGQTATVPVTLTVK